MQNLVELSATVAQKELKKKEKALQLLVKPFFGRDDWIRTSDHTPPRRVL